MNTQPQWLSLYTINQMFQFGTSHPGAVHIRLRSGCCNRSHYVRAILVDDLCPTSIRTLCTCPGDTFIASSVLPLYSFMKGLLRLGDRRVSDFSSTTFLRLFVRILNPCSRFLEPRCSTWLKCTPTPPSPEAMLACTLPFRPVSSHRDLLCITLWAMPTF